MSTTAVTTPSPHSSPQPARTATLLLSLLLTLGLLVLTAGCSSVYYGAMEKFGIEKRDILVDRVEDARDSQNEARDTFRSSLERFQETIDTPDTDLKSKYEDIRDAYEDSEAIAERVRDRIDAVENVAEDLFDEWEDELGRYESASMRQTSERQLAETKDHYQQLIKRMHEAESRMEPVLQIFEDQMLFLKHNLNAQAIASLESELTRIRQDVNDLVRDMERSIAESEAFIKRFQDSSN